MLVINTFKSPEEVNKGVLKELGFIMQPCHVPNVNSIGPSSSTTFPQAVLGYGRLIPALLDDTVSKNVKSAPGSELRCTSRRSLWDGNV